ncbi:MAG: class B sortase [Clostridiales bacterium]|nr:class B sortase [Clostridiales bacterium]
MDEKKKKNSKRIILIIIALILFICAAVYIGVYLYNNYAAQHEYDDISTSENSQSNGQTVSNPIDFSSLQSQNNEIYAWLKVDGTDIDYPVVQSSVSDDFYLRHSALDKSYISSGAIYTESVNSTDFSDPVTVIYGHNGYKETMFTSLHEFEDADFFNNNEYFYIYTPQRKLTYQIISAFKYDDRHIMNSFDFNSQDDLKNFQNTVINPSSALKNVRTELDTQINEDSKIVVLSTCITNQKSNRYLVCGVLVKDEKTD